MKKTTRLTALLLCVLIFVSTLPLVASADNYDVFLNHGPQGWGSEAWPAQKIAGQPLALHHTRDTIFNNYGMLPGYYVMNDQRVFIEWNTAFDAKTGRGTGHSYYDYYTADTPATLYAIWGYNIQFNADGGKYATTGNGVYLTYVANFNNSNYEDPLTDYQYCMPDLLGDVPEKPGCRRVMYNGNYAYGLLRNDLRFFTWEGPGQNLTIPPTGGAMPWSAFHCVNTHRGLSLEFFAIWEPSITYDANGGSGYMDVDYLDFTYDALWNYEYYSVKNCAYSKPGTYFTGWNTKPDGTGISVAPGTSWGGQMTNSDPITLYAQWADGSTGHKHSYSSTVTVQPTCTDTGVRTYKCSCGESYTEVIAALGHTTKTTTTEATCTQAGKTVTTCTRCNASVTQEIPALGHNYSTVTTNASCTSEGKTVLTCRRCGDTKTTITPALGHSYDNGVITTKPSCNVEGVKTFTCTACGESYTETLPGLTHTFGGYVYNKDATCTKDGTQTRTCITCFATETVAAEGTKVDHLFYDYVSNGDATCTNDGTMTAYCEYGCGTEDVIKDMGSALGHAWGDWIVTVAPTTTTVGTETRTCTVCSATQTQEIPMLDVDAPVVADVSNYTVTINGVKDVKEIRFGIGEYTTLQQFRDDPDSLTLSAALANNYIVDGVFTYDVAYTGHYTFCIRHNDGTNDFIGVDVDEINTYLTSDGLRLTTTDMKAASLIKDMWIAEGTCTTYSEIKNNVAAGAKYQATSTKLANYFATNDFTFTMYNPGEHTVLIRYNDGSVEYHHITLTVDVPTFDVNGLQVTVGNIPGVKIIRSAYGHYNSIAEIKTAPVLRCFNNKTAIKDAESYKIQYRENGEVTIIVEYNTGYKHVEHINIEQKVPTFEQNGDSVILGDLDGLVVVRYAPGTYTTAGGVKNAADSKYIKPESIVDGHITINDLIPGKWTVCVQYDDESYNFYHITVA